MSIVAVHGPHTMGSRAIVQTGSVVGVVDPANGLKWDFRLDAGTTRSDQDFSWAFPTDGTPTPQLLADPAVVTYATPGSKTATLTVTNTARTVSNKALTSNVATITTSATHGFKIGQWITIAGVGAPFDGTYVIATTPSGTTFTFAKVNADVTSAASGGSATSATTAVASSQYPAAGSYPIIVTAAAGAGPATGLMSMQGDGGEEPPPEAPPAEGPYVPGDHNVPEVEEYATAHPDEWDDILADEEAGKNRVTLVDWLTANDPNP